MDFRPSYILSVLFVLAVILTGCSSTKHVPEGSYLVDKVSINIVDNNDVKSADLINYLRQLPNHKVLGFARIQLATYNLSGSDTTKWYNRWFRRIGQPPVIYDQTLTDASMRQLKLAMINRGYMDTKVTFDTITHPDKKKVEVIYNVVPGLPHRISEINYEIPDSAVAAIVLSDTTQYNLHLGDLLDSDMLDEMRGNVASRLQNRGYYAFTKEYITFYADTVDNSKDVALTLCVRPPVKNKTSNPLDSIAVPLPSHRKYVVDNVYFITDYTPGESMESLCRKAVETVDYHGMKFLYGDDRYIRPSILEEKCFIIPGDVYRERNVELTYEGLSRLGIIRTVNINIVPVGDQESGPGRLNVYILLSRNKKQSLTFDLEGTNSEGDLGVGGGITYQHRNLGHRSNLLTVKARASYESISGNLDGFINDRYTEYAGEAGITFPKFQMPFLSRDFKRRVKASTEFTVSFNHQERPEYTRIIAGAAWKYKWNDRRNFNRRTWDLIDINYVYLPKSTSDFIDQIAPDNPLLRYSYEDHFIMRMGFTYVHTNKRISTATATSVRRYTFQPIVYNFRASIETAGNLLYGISHLVGAERKDGVYKVFGVPYSQYAKAEFDYTITRNFNTRHSLAFHIGTGVGVPYGNSTVMPFEKRFYAGGANGVRGWAVRTLGPGTFDSKNSVTSFMEQCGDIRLDLSVEYRAKLFWVVEGGLFVDAGNIWTIRDYENQPGGLFRINNFWKEMAWAYGIGIRLDFTYFLFRFDLGMKAYNPAVNQQHWPIIHPNWHRDATFHFAVGYPF